MVTMLNHQILCEKDFVKPKGQNITTNPEFNVLHEKGYKISIHFEDKNDTT